jgi:isoleucyl-tRNA synthetase
VTPSFSTAAAAFLQVSFPVKSAGAAAAGAAIEGSHFVAWTTTPWTLPSNLALCVHPELVYVQVRLLYVLLCFLLLSFVAS